MSVNRTMFREIFIFRGRERRDGMGEVCSLFVHLWDRATYIVFADAD